MSKRSPKQKLAAALVVAALAGGAVAAALTVKGQSHPKHHPLRNLAAAAPTSATASAATDLPVAASYLGVSSEQLRHQLREGRTLAQLAQSGHGKSTSALIDKLVAGREQRLHALVVQGRLSKSTADRLAANLRRRVTRAVNRVRGGSRDLATSAAYLNTTLPQLQSRLRAGTTLAQVAQASGKSASGLIAALVADRKQRLAAAVAEGRLSKAQQSRVEPTLTRRVTVLVNRKFPKRSPAVASSS